MNLTKRTELRRLPSRGSRDLDTINAILDAGFLAHVGFCVAHKIDPERKSGRAYQAKNTPNMLVINPEGKIVYEGAIDSKVTPNPADIRNPTNFVKVALDESLAEKPVTTSRTKPYGCAVEYK
jgi:hypothetical protein